MTPTDPKSLVARLDGSPLIIMLDIDGTLCEIVERPDDATVPSGVMASLSRLNELRDRGVHLAFVTGRSAADATRMITVDGAVIYANHGSERIDGSGNIREPRGWKLSGPILAEASRQLATLSSEFPGTSLEDKRYSLTFHFRGMDFERLPDLTSRVMEITDDDALLTAFGKAVINIVPAGAHDKGDAALEIVRDIAGEPAAAGTSILFAGDDVTDEDAFRALENIPGAVTVRVGSSGGSTTSSAAVETTARYAVSGTAAVHRLLKLLVEARQ